jgi:hypothetical protein
LIVQADETKRPKLSFIVGGAQKAGTTSLFGYLKEHPSLLAPLKKELHFFDDETIDWSKPDYSSLAKWFPTGSIGKIAFDATPIYLFWPPSLKRIQRYDPAMKLIFMFRDPIERAWSHWRMEYERNAETLPFGAAIRHGRRRLQGISQLDPAWRIYSYVERGFYGMQVRRLLDLFPRENVLFLRADDLKTAHSLTLAVITDFLGLPSFSPLPPRLDHQGKYREEKIPQDDITYLRGIFRDELLEFSKLAALPIADWLTLSDLQAGG